MLRAHVIEDGDGWAYEVRDSEGQVVGEGAGWRTRSEVELHVARVLASPDALAFWGEVVLLEVRESVYAGIAQSDTGANQKIFLSPWVH